VVHAANGAEVVLDDASSTAAMDVGARLKEMW
jgi:hypothetical protein